MGKGPGGAFGLFPLGWTMDQQRNFCLGSLEGPGAWDPIFSSTSKDEHGRSRAGSMDGGWRAQEEAGVRRERSTQQRGRQVHRGH